MVTFVTVIPLIANSTLPYSLKESLLPLPNKQSNQWKLPPRPRDEQALVPALPQIDIFIVPLKAITTWFQISFHRCR